MSIAISRVCPRNHLLASSRRIELVSSSTLFRSSHSSTAAIRRRDLPLFILFLALCMLPRKAAAFIVTPAVSESSFLLCLVVDALSRILTRSADTPANASPPSSPFFADRQKGASILFFILDNLMFSTRRKAVACVLRAAALLTLYTSILQIWSPAEVLPPISSLNRKVYILPY